MSFDLYMAKVSRFNWSVYNKNIIILTGNNYLCPVELIIR